ncbi:hypothetical protein, partial [Roseibium hamelinense]
FEENAKASFPGKKSKLAAHQKFGHGSRSHLNYVRTNAPSTSPMPSQPHDPLQAILDSNLPLDPFSNNANRPLVLHQAPGQNSVLAPKQVFNPENIADLDKFKYGLQQDIRNLKDQRKKCTRILENHKFELFKAQQVVSNIDRTLEASRGLSQDLKNQNISPALVEDFDKKAVHTQENQKHDWSKKVATHAHNVESLNREVERLNEQIVSKTQQLVSTYSLNEFRDARKASQKHVLQCKHGLLKAESKGDFESEKQANKQQKNAVAWHNFHLKNVRKTAELEQRLQQSAERLGPIAREHRIQRSIDRLNQLGLDRQFSQNDFEVVRANCHFVTHLGTPVGRPNLLAANLAVKDLHLENNPAARNIVNDMVDDHMDPNPAQTYMEVVRANCHFVSNLSTHVREPSLLAANLAVKELHLEDNPAARNIVNGMVDDFMAAQALIKDTTSQQNTKLCQENVVLLLGQKYAQSDLEIWKAEQRLAAANDEAAIFEQLDESHFKHRADNTVPVDITEDDFKQSEIQKNETPSKSTKSRIAANNNETDKKPSKTEFQRTWNDKQLASVFRELESLVKSKGDLDHLLNESVQALAEAELQKCKNIANNLPRNPVSRAKTQRYLITRMTECLDQIYSNPKRTKRYALHQECSRLVKQDMNNVSNRLNAGFRHLPYATDTGHGNERAYTIGQTQGKTYDAPAYLKTEIEAKYSGNRHEIQPKRQVTIYDARDNIPPQHLYPELSHGARFNLRADNDAPMNNLRDVHFYTDTHNSTTVSSRVKNETVPATSITVHVEDADNRARGGICGTVHMRYQETQNGHTVKRHMKTLGYRSIDQLNNTQVDKLNKDELAVRRIDRKFAALDRTKGTLEGNAALHAKALKETLQGALPELNWDQPANTLKNDNPQAAECLSRIPKQFFDKLGVKVGGSDTVEDTFDKITQAINKQLDGLDV